jgi:hypothetical protein
LSDLATWNLQGPVHTLRVEHAEWDLAREEWQSSRHYGVYTFRPDGKTQESEHHNPDGSVVRSSHEYDESGRLLEIRVGPPDSPAGRTIYRYDSSGRRIETVIVAADGTTRQSHVTRYDSTGRKITVLFLEPQEPGVTCGFDIESLARDEDCPDELVVQDALGRVVSRSLFTRDSAGRLLTASQLPAESWLQDIEKAIESENAENRDEQVAALRSIFGFGQPISTITYTYDEAGRLAERNVRMGPNIGPLGLGGHRTTYSYDENGVEVGNTTEDYPRRLGIDENGAPVVQAEESRRQDIHFEYCFDERRNWTERVTWSRLHPNPNFQRSSVERRQISYYL